jgi:hypothetical protein
LGFSIQLSINVAITTIADLMPEIFTPTNRRI